MQRTQPMSQALGCPRLRLFGSETSSSMESRASQPRSSTRSLADSRLLASAEMILIEKDATFPTDVETSKDFALIFVRSKADDAQRGEDQNTNSNETHHEPKLSPFRGIFPLATASLWITLKLSTAPLAGDVCSMPRLVGREFDLVKTGPSVGLAVSAAGVGPSVMWHHRRYGRV